VKTEGFIAADEVRFGIRKGEPYLGRWTHCAPEEGETWTQLAVVRWADDEKPYLLSERIAAFTNKDDADVAVARRRHNGFDAYRVPLTPGSIT
jgi:hypothetical protein